MNASAQIDAGFLAELATILGEGNLLTDTHSCSLYAQDIFTKDKPALAVVQPLSTEALVAVVKLSTAAGYTLVPHGGGVSYSSGYVPAADNTIMVSFKNMTRVIEINRDDMYVTVECGCSWKDLHLALKETGLRTPFWGTLSGIKATVGGGLSQNAMFWGSGQFGTAADSVIGLEVVMADGTVLTTGSAAQANANGFFRHFGPDLTGLFTSDNGALGFKTKATFRLIPELPAKQFVSLDFQTGAEALGAMGEIARRNLAAECFGFDPFLQKQRMKRESLATDVKALTGVLKSSGSILGAVKDGLGVALAGRRYMKDVQFSIHLICEDRYQAGADARANEIREIAKTFNGREIENSIPKITSANPFGPINSMVGPQGERWVPVHGILPHSKTVAAFEGIEALLQKHRAILDQYEIGVGYLFSTLSGGCFVLEPVFFWPDALQEIHQEHLTADALKRIGKGFDENLDARAAVKQVRAEIAALLSDIGAVHLQLGKSYQFRDAIPEQNWALLQTLKDAVDPGCAINPAALGFVKH